jgi:hypothetical protein
MRLGSSPIIQTLVNQSMIHGIEASSRSGTLQGMYTEGAESASGYASNQCVSVPLWACAQAFVLRPLTIATHGFFRASHQVL